MKIVESSKQEGTPKPDNPVQITNETVLIITDKEGNKKEMPFKYEKILKEGDKIEKINGEWCLVRRKPMNDIKILELFIKSIRSDLHDDSEDNQETAEAIENLIQRNKDLEQIEKEHKEENGRLREENINLKEKIIRQQEQLNIANKKILAQKGQLKVVNNSYIPKSKVKEIIKLLDKEEKKTLKGTKGQDRYSIKLEYMYKRNALQELLEESEK